MNLFDLFKKEENLQLEKKTLVILRWIANLGQLFTVIIVYFLFKFTLPIAQSLIIIILGILTNLYLQLWFKKRELTNFDSTIILLYDLIQLSILLFFTGGIKNPFVIFLVVPAIVSSTLLNLKSTYTLSILTIIILIILTTFHYPLPHPGNLHFHVPDYYLYSLPLATVIVLIFLAYFGSRFGLESRQKIDALNKLELIMAKERELESIGHQAAAAAHSLGTPLSTITVIAKELKKEINQDSKYSKDVDLLLSQAKRCSEILKKISLNQMGNDKFMSSVSFKNLLTEIVRSFEEISKKRISLNVEESQKETIITRSPEITYGIRNFVGNAVKYSKSEVNIFLKVDRYKVKLIISDNGPGFSNEVLENIGKPYIGSDSAVLKEKSGLGLGTFIGQTLLERKKASLEFSNSQRGGALVNISWNLDDIKI
tara:strand:+ start:3795 stop:5075 length:1281 start_codon:yes stop_codon:yes gene_type:complete